MVTLTGVGGVGKTRLAVQVAAEVLPRFRQGAWLVELAPVRNAESVLEAAAKVFDVAARPGLTLEQSLVEFLRHKELLMVLDNCEHVLDEAAELMEMLEQSCPRVQMLATSREGLGIDGERILAVPSLGSPRPEASLATIVDADSGAAVRGSGTRIRVGAGGDRGERRVDRAGVSASRWGAPGDRVGCGAATGDESRVISRLASTAGSNCWRGVGGARSNGTKRCGR